MGLDVSKMTSITKVNDIPVITGQTHFSFMTLGRHRTRAVHNKRNMDMYALMLEDAATAAYAIYPEGSILASAQAAVALLVGTGSKRTPYHRLPSY